MHNHRAARTLAAVGLAVALAVPSALAPGAGALPATAAPEPSVTAADAIPGGPRPTSLRLSDDDASTTVLVHGLGDAQVEQGRENRQRRHSDHQPTARFVTAGQQLTVTVPDGAPEVSVVIGLHGTYADHNGGVSTSRRSVDLQPGVNDVVPPVDGMVWHKSTAVGGSADVVVAGGRPVPSFVLGQTTNHQLRAEMARLADAPFVTVIGDRIFGDFPTDRTGPALAASDVTGRVTMWDRSAEITNATYGLSDHGTGTARKAPHRIYVAAPDAIPGAYATAGDESINLPAGGAARDLFARDQTGLGITVPAGTHTVGTGLDWTITGTADGETVRARS